MLSFEKLVRDEQHTIRTVHDSKFDGNNSE